MLIIKTILRFRLNQFGRMLKSVGWLLLLLALPISIGFILRLLEWTTQTNPWSVGVLLVAILASSHFQRKDGQWLKHLGLGLPKIFAIEYFSVCLPFSILFLALFNNWQTPFILQSGALILAFLPPVQHHITGRNTWLPLDLLPSEAFEWKAGIRQYFPWLLILYLIGFGVSIFVAGTLIVLVVFGFLTIGFYDEFESKELLEAIHLNGGILKRKVLTHSIVFHLLMLPHYLLFLMLHTQYWYFLLTVVILLEMLILFGNFYKYSKYLPNRRRAYNGTAMSLFFLGIINPFFILVSLGALIVFGRRAVKRIDYFFQPK